MKALSVKQPWASLLVSGQKTIECRTWKTSYRGPLLICSSKGDWPMDNEGNFCPGGMALGVIELLDVRRMKKEDIWPAWLPQNEEIEKAALKGYAWVTKPLYKIEPIPTKGKLNIFDINIEIKKLPWEHPDYLTRLIELCLKETDD